MRAIRSLPRKEEKNVCWTSVSRMQKFAVSSYLGELDGLVWACKTYQGVPEGVLPIVVRTDNHALIEDMEIAKSLRQR